jgi:NAD(P)-dependent dehydrogenase (short-subunit alcohol dehydrogenase family)
MGKLEGKVAVITGGAGGIGTAAVRLFCQEGARVVFADIDDAKGELLAKEVGEGAIFQRADVTSEAEISALIERAGSEFGGLDIMFSNAGGFGARGSLTEIEVADFDATLALLIRSVFLGMKHAGAVMLEQGSGAILNTASISATTPGYGPHIYQAAKAAVVTLSQSAALEFAEKGVRVNCVSPGGVPTPLISNALGVGDDAMQGIAKGMSYGVPMGRTATPEDIARAAVFLCSDDAEYITAQNLVVDGGESTGKKFSKQALN